MYGLGAYGGFGGYGAGCCYPVGRVGLGQVPGPGGVGTLRPVVTSCCGVSGGGWGVGTGIIAIAILILIALGVIF